MVLEALFNPFAVKKKPWEMFIAGFLYAIVGLMLSYLVFKESAGLLTVFLIVLATVPLLYATITNEEELDFQFTKEISILKEHGKVIAFLTFFFLGVSLALSLAYIFLPTEIVNTSFSLQQQAISNVNNNISGNLTQLDVFTRIFANNLRVLFFSLVFAFLYGTGSIFIITWNASVVATAMGSLFKTELAKAASFVGFSGASAYFGAASFSILRYMTHGLLEMASYFVAGLAGGIISVALIKHNLKEDKVLIDAVDLMLLSIAILFVAGLVEVYVTPKVMGLF